MVFLFSLLCLCIPAPAWGRIESSSIILDEKNSSADTWNVLAVEALATAVRGIHRRLGSALNQSDTTGKKQVIFFAGVQGSGHRLLESIFRKLAVSPIVEGARLEKLAFPEEWGCRPWDIKAIPKMIEIFERLNSDSDVIWTLPQRASFPQCHTYHISNHVVTKLDIHPRIDWITAAARKAGVDLHIILIYRPLYECLLAGCQHRHIKNCSSQADTLQSNAGFLFDQISRTFQIPGPVHCFRYGNRSSMKLAFRQAYNTGVAPASIDNAFDRLWKPRPQSTSEEEKLLFLHDVYKHTLAAPNKLLLDLCKSTE